MTASSSSSPFPFVVSVLPFELSFCSPAHDHNKEQMSEGGKDSPGRGGEDRPR